MRKSTILVLMLPLLGFVAYLGYRYVSGGGVGWNPLPERERQGSPINTGALGSLLRTAVTPSPPARTLGAVGPVATPSQTARPTSTPTRTRGPVPSSSTPNPPTASVTHTDLPPIDEASAGIEVAERIIAAIEGYRLIQAVYPSALADLLPDYFSTIPETPLGQPFTYRSFPPGHAMESELYWLSFPLSRQPGMACTFYRRLEHWDCTAGVLPTAP